MSPVMRTQLPCVAIAIVMGICMRRHMIRDWFGVFTTSALVSVVAVVVSTPFNLIFFQGYNGNLWGDALFDMFRYYRIPVVVASVLSELLVDIFRIKWLRYASYLVYWVSSRAIVSSAMQSGNLQVP